jgi:hypothetical protein
MKEDPLAILIQAAFKITALSGTAALCISLFAPEPCPSLLQRVFDACLTVFTIGAMGTVTLYRNRPREDA